MHHCTACLLDLIAYRVVLSAEGVSLLELACRSKECAPVLLAAQQMHIRHCKLHLSHKPSPSPSQTSIQAALPAATVVCPQVHDRHRQSIFFLILFGNAVVDWNPSGVAILCQYRYGSIRMGLESPHYAVPGIHWLVARQHQLEGIEQQV